MDIVVEELVKHIEGKKAINSISFGIRRNEVVGFLGPRRSGKSTLMKLLAGVIPPDSGHIAFNNKPFPGHARTIKNNIGYLSGQNPLYGEMGVIDFLYYMARLHHYPSSRIRGRITEIIRLCKLENEKHKEIRELSKGYRQRLGIAQALIHDPQILILDEPTAGLDPNQANIIRHIIQTAGVGKTILITSGILEEIESICNRVLMISGGKIIADDPISDFRKRSASRVSFRISIRGGDVRIIHETLSALPEICQIDPIGEQNFEFQCIPECKIESSIFNVCSRHNWYIAELTPLQTRLEDIFQQITQN